MDFNKITKQMEDVDFDRIAQQLGEAAERADTIAQQVGQMAERGNELTQQAAEVAERVVENVSGAVRKRGRKGGHGARWLILPAVGAAVYAVARNRSVGHSAKALAGQAKDRASEMQEMDLLGRVKEVAGLEGNGQHDDEARPSLRRRTSPAQLEKNRRERAERRQRRRKSTSTR